MNPGISTRPFRSIVFAARYLRASSSPPTAMILPSLTATADLIENALSMVNTLPPLMRRSTVGSCARTAKGASTARHDNPMTAGFLALMLSLVGRGSADDGADDMNILDFLGIHRMRILGQDHEVRELARGDGPLDRFLPGGVGTIDRADAQRLVDADSLVGAPDLSVPPGASHHALDAHQRRERARIEVRPGRHRDARVEKRPIGHASLHDLFTVEMELIGVVVGI